MKLANVPATLPLPSTFAVSDSNGKVYAVTNIAATTVPGEYKLTLGTAVEGKGTLTVKHGESQATKDFDTTIAGLKLSVDVADEDYRLIADGADNTIIKITVKRDGVVDENFKGEVKFQSLKGAKFAKEAVAFDKGVAQVQVTSISSPIVVNDTIIATVSQAEDPDFIGERIAVNLQYVPADGNGDIDKKVFITSAESDRASDVYVKFNDKIDFNKLYADWDYGKGEAKIIVRGKGLTSNADVDREVLDIVKVDDRTIKLVLAEEEALKDNSAVTILVNDERIKGLLQKSEYPFNLVDSDAPKAVKVTAPDYKTLVAEFNEPVSAAVAEKPSNWVLNGHRLTDADIVSIKVGNIVDEDGNVESYVRPTATTEAIDNRHFVTIKLTETKGNGVNYYKQQGAKNLLQAYNIHDYAGKTDTTGQNTATTQEFEFITPVVPEAGSVDFVLQSPEQFKIKFDEPVQKVGGGDLSLANFNFERQHGFDKDGNPVWVAYNTDVVNLQFPVMLTKDKKNGSVYYFELQDDWTVILDTEKNNINYYTPGYNKVRLTLKKDQIESKRTGAKYDQDVVKVIEMELDDTAPTFTAKQVVEKNVPQKRVAITMSEPIQMALANGDAANTEGTTKSQTQEKVPTPTFEFVSKDKKTTILGKLVEGSLSEDDTQFEIEPIEPDKLTAGDWTVYIRSISDDIGNTSDTLKQDLTILPTEQEKGKAQIIWAEAIDNIDALKDGVIKPEDVVVIQFGTEMSLDAYRSSIYTINGKPLPEGVNITATEAEYTNSGLKGTRVTITLPKTFLGDTSDEIIGKFSEPHILNVNKRLEDAAGNRLISPSEVELTYDLDGTGSLYVIPEIDKLVNGDKTPGEITDADAVAAAKDALDLGDTSAVTSDLTLPTTGENGVTISWASDKEDVVSTEGKVTRPANGSGDATVKLTATLKKGTATETKEFTVVVKEQTP
ncbi:immunoglobulin-like domain-containing protein [Brevibacillus sp. FSL K6-2834]|uniref:immunoglobulin-like domain-containing protein n=1 Tax=Brevibacillus sp. FSL K6-2834 TaxID=2954680 RepID=UPI00315833EC